MPNSEDAELEELLNRMHDAMSQEPGNPAGAQAWEDDDDFPTDGPEDGQMLYRNYSNGYGRNVRNYSNGYGRGETPPAPEQPVTPIRAYNADFQGDHKGTPQPPREPEELSGPVPKKKKTAASKAKPPRRHRRSGCLTSLVVVLVLLGVVVGIAAAWIRPPKTDQSVADRKSGTSAILLCGADVGGVRTDTMMILYVNSKTRQAGLLSLPRDTYTKTLYGEDAKLNSAYGRNGCGEEGMEVLLDYVQRILGYRPDGYVLVELPALKDLVDLMGGVEFDVPHAFDFQRSDMDIDVHLEAGLQHIDGEQALAIVRERYSYVNQDLGRVDTQKAFLKACLQQWLKPSNLGKAKDVLALLKEQSMSSLSTGNYVWFGMQLLRCKDLRTDTLPGYATYIGDQSFFVLDPEEVVDLVNEGYNPYQKEFTTADVDIAGEN